MTLLAKDPNERLQSAEDAIRSLQGLIARAERAPLGSPARLAAFARTPLGLLVIVFFVLAVFVVTFVVGRRASGDDEALAAGSNASPASTPAESQAAGPAQELERALVRAEVGDERAWRRLEETPEDSRSARLWFILGVARSEHGERRKGLEAYLKAVDRERRYGSNWRLLRDLLLATDDREAWPRALSVAAALPGPRGADILFHVWASTPKSNAKTEQAKSLLETDGVRARASEAVRVALDLRNVRGEGCDARRKLLPRAAEHGDARSLLPLLKMTSRRGCGPAHDKDCFACLRGDPLLEQAIDRAKKHPPPDYSKEHPPVGH
jgi:hypothetical protein